MEQPGRLGGRRRALATAGMALGLAGVAWLGPLMVDQFVLFGDQDQTAAARNARAVMPWPASLLAIGAAMIAAAGRVRAAAVAASPIAAVGMAIATPEALWQLLTYGVTAPLSIGAMLSAVVPIGGRRLRQPWVLVALLLVGLALALLTAFLGTLVIIGIVAWWLLSRATDGGRDESALD